MAKKDLQELSPNQKAFRRLLKNKPAVFGLLLIGFALTISILGYLITPDRTPNANDQVNEVALEGPFFKIDMLKVRKNRAYESQSFLKTMLFGKANPYRLVPMNSYDIQGDTIEVNVYQGKDRAGKTERFHLVDIIHPIAVSDPVIETDAAQYAYYPIDREKSATTLADLVQQFERNKTQPADPQAIHPVIEADSAQLAVWQNDTEINWLPIRQNGPNQTFGTGDQAAFWWIPSSASSIQQDSVLVTLADSAQSQLAFHLVDAVYRLPEVYSGIESSETGFSFFDNTLPKTAVEASSIRQLVESKHIYKHRYVLGTDKFGRDLLSRLMIGVRISLSVGLVAVLISLTIGILFGAIAGYFGGRVDDLIMLLINTMWSIPTLLLVFALVLALGRGFWQIFTAVGLTMWVDVARIVRGQVMTVKEIQFVEAARSFGFQSSRIIMRHILPNIFGPVMVIAAANFAAAILIEAGLSYLGFGIQPPQPSWGTMLSENYSYLIKSDNPFPALAPGLAIMFMVLAFNLVGNGFRDALDVKTRR